MSRAPGRERPRALQPQCDPMIMARARKSWGVIQCISHFDVPREMFLSIGKDFMEIILTERFITKTCIELHPTTNGSENLFFPAMLPA